MRHVCHRSFHACVHPSGVISQKYFNQFGTAMGYNNMGAVKQIWAASFGQFSSDLHPSRVIYQKYLNQL